MLVRRKKLFLVSLGVICTILMTALCLLREYLAYQDKDVNRSSYSVLLPDTDEEDPLRYVNDDFTVQEGFHTNLPIVILSMDEDVSDYKGFTGGEEYLTGEEPYVRGHISIIDGEGEENYITDRPVSGSSLRMKKRGHTSYVFDKEQYLLKLETEDRLENKIDILGMGEHDSWILNGSMADKSMIRNYLAYRIASEVDETTPDSRFCEVILQKDGEYVYQGLYLMMESVARDSHRIPIDKYKEKNSYSSYIVRRDRRTSFDRMLDTYGRLSGISEEWIGVKYPSEAKLTDKVTHYIEEDFSRIEKVLYSDQENVFVTYGRYIDIHSFVDYFLLNEYFGNYDAGMHSTYMYKNTGEPLKIGPVWDFDQAMNNYFQEEMNTETLAFQERPFFEQLCKDRRFVELLQSRYASLQKGALNEDHVYDVIDEAVLHIRSAREREWNRWIADYEDNSRENWRNYYLDDYIDDDGTQISRFNDDYDQEIYNIKVYLHKHGEAMETQLQILEKSVVYDTSVRNEKELLLLVILILFFIPAVVLMRRG